MVDRYTKAVAGRACANTQPVVIINIRGMTPADSEKELYEIVDNLLCNGHFFCSFLIF